MIHDDKDLPATLTPCTLTPRTQSQTADSTSSEEKQPWGRLLSQNDSVATFELREPTFTLGRSSECSCCLQQSTWVSILSRVHFAITKCGPDVTIKDMSKNGTYINGRPIGRYREVALEHGDVIGVMSAQNLFYKFSINDDMIIPQFLKQKYVMTRLLGRGACGEVRLAYNKQTTKHYAIKRIIKSVTTTNILTHPSRIQAETKILQRLQHPFVVELEEVLETDNEVYIVLEYVRGGELTQRINSEEVVSEAEAKYIFYQILLAVSYLHRNAITHRDLKPQNILISSAQPYPKVKIADFGLSKIMDEVTFTATICGTLHYVAPEILLKNKYTKCVDVWSIGIILYMLLTQQFPFLAPNNEILKKKIINGVIEWCPLDDCSKSCQDLVRRMLCVDPKKRITVDEILNHPWIFQDLELQHKISELLMSHLESPDNEYLTVPKKARYE